MLTKEEVLKIANLARIQLSGEEAETLRGDLSAILAFVQKLEEVPIEGVEATSHVGGVPASLRQDEARIIGDKEKMRIRAMIEQFPSRKGNYLQVPHVFSAQGGPASGRKDNYIAPR